MSRIDINIDLLRDLNRTHDTVIPESYLDAMGHMNIQYYVLLYERATWEMLAQLGLTLEAMQAHQAGMFALRQFIQYLAEVKSGEHIVVYSRVLEISAKRLHFMHFMVNETTLKLASTFEVLAAYVDMNTRRSAPFAPDFAAGIQSTLNIHRALAWDAPVCGILGV